MKSAAILPPFLIAGLMLLLLCNGVSPALTATWICLAWFVFVLAVKIGDMP